MRGTRSVVCSADDTPREHCPELNGHPQTVFVCVATPWIRNRQHSEFGADSEHWSAQDISPKRECRNYCLNCSSKSQTSTSSTNTNISEPTLHPVERSKSTLSITPLANLSAQNSTSPSHEAPNYATHRWGMTSHCRE